MAEAVAVEVGNAVVSGVASKVTEILFDPIQREICYVFKYKGYVEKLRRQLEDLNGIKQRLQQNVGNAERQGDKIFDDVEKYLMKMNELIARAEKLVYEKEDKVKNKRCFIGLCPNLMSRRKLSKEAVNAEEDADNLVKEGNSKLDRAVSYRPAPDRNDIMNVVRGYQEFHSRKEVFQKVMEALKDSNVNMIGLYGMGGVGKTTLAKQVQKKVLEDKSFDEVVMAEVTQNPVLKTIQDKFAYDLGLTFLQHESEFERAGRLRRRLKEKRVLLILDNIWAELNLEDIGIHFGDDEKEGKDVQKLFTVLLTSRNQHVSLNGLNCQKNFHVKELSNAEAMILFWKTVDDLSIETSDFQNLADEIVRKCGGLPVAIKTIAAALKNKAIEVWRDALNRLTNSNPRDIPGMEANVYSAIKLSYNILVNKEAKSLFRLCALQKDGSKIPINDLVMCVMGSGWFKTVNRLEQARDRVHALIDNLKSSCLLMDGDAEHVKMHDIIHAVGVSIASEEHMFNIQGVDDLKEELENVVSKDPIAISLNCRDIEELPQRLEYPKLELFLFFSNYDSSLKNTFFEGMEKLRVLNLAQIRFPSSPPSLIFVTCLVNLRTLSLNDCCSLVDVALVGLGELKKLEILSFRGSDIEKFPSEIGQLTRLKKLDLSYCSRLTVIAPNVISKLSQLEELCVINSFTQWEKGEGGNNASLVELNALSQLTTLEINITDVEIVTQDFMSLELERFKIFVGEEWGRIHSYNKGETLRTLKLGGLDKNIYFGKGMKMLLKRAEDLYLGRLNGLENLFHEFFPCQNLTKLEVKHCSQLKFLFSYATVHSLGQLQNLMLEGCKSMECVINTNGLRRDEEQMIGIIVFSKLKSLTLSNLPTFTRFLSMSSSDTNIQSLFDEKVTFPTLETLKLSKLSIEKIWLHQFSTCQNLTRLEVKYCNHLKFLFDEKVTFPILEILELYELNIEKIWLDQFSTCQNLTRLEVKYCNHLKFLFSYSMVHSLGQLQNLVIERCKSMECVINTNELRRDEEQMIGAMVFSKLNSLTLLDLPTLKRFLSMSSSQTDKQSLFDDKVVFPNLETLRIEKMYGLIKIWHHQLDSNSFSKLKKLEVRRCCKLMNIFSLSIILGERFERLESLLVVSCDSIKKIVEEETSFDSMAVEEVPRVSTSSKFPVFPQLTSLYLYNLPSLTNIYQGIHKLVWPTLKDLKVARCEKVEILFSSSQVLNGEIESQRPMFLVDNDKVAFPNLKTLKVSECHALRNLTSLSTVENLIKLKRIEIYFCAMIEEIVQQIGEVKEDPIIFSKLVYLELHNLPRLKHFLGGNYTLEFPCLEKMVVSYCLSMKIFSEGVLRTPKLQKVQLDREVYERE